MLLISAANSPAGKASSADRHRTSGSHGAHAICSAAREFSLRSIVIGAAGGASVVRGLLIVQFAVDDLIEILPGIISDQPAAIQKHGRRGVHMQRAPLRHGGVDLGFGGLGIDAASELQASRSGTVLAKSSHLGLQIVGGDVGLMFVNPVMILPESGGFC